MGDERLLKFEASLKASDQVEEWSHFLRIRKIAVTLQKWQSRGQMVIVWYSTLLPVKLMHE